MELKNEEALWKAVVLFQNYTFHTASGVQFSFELKKGRDGTFDKELLVRRRNERETIVWSSVMLAFRMALEMKGEVVERPEEMGDIRGISYIYPLCRLGVVDGTEEMGEKMQVRRRGKAVR